MRALELLVYLGALDNNGNLTTLGSVMAGFPLDPQMSKMLIVSPDFRCSNEILTIVSMLSGMPVSSIVHSRIDQGKVPNIWLRPPNRQKEADAAKAMLADPDSDHITLLNTYNAYIQSEHATLSIMNQSHSYALQINTTRIGAGPTSSHNVQYYRRTISEFSYNGTWRNSRSNLSLCLPITQASMQTSGWHS